MCEQCLREERIRRHFSVLVVLPKRSFDLRWWCSLVEVASAAVTSPTGPAWAAARASAADRPPYHFSHPRRCRRRGRRPGPSQRAA